MSIQHNSRGPLGVIATILKGCFWQILNIILRFVFMAFLDLNLSTVDVVLTWYWAHFDKSYKRNQIGAWNISCLWPLIAHQWTINYKPRTSWALSIKAMWRIAFETPWGKLQNVLRIKLTTDVTLLFLSPINNIYLFSFYVTGVDYEFNSIHQKCMLFWIGIEYTLDKNVLK